MTWLDTTTVRRLWWIYAPLWLAHAWMLRTLVGNNVVSKVFASPLSHAPETVAVILAFVLLRLAVCLTWPIALLSFVLWLRARWRRERMQHAGRPVG